MSADRPVTGGHPVVRRPGAPATTRSRRSSAAMPGSWTPRPRSAPSG